MPHGSDQRPAGPMAGEVRDRAHGTLPGWAHWNAQPERRYTLGVEEEVMLLHPADWSMAQSSDAVLAGLTDELLVHTFPETHAGVVELATGIHADVRGAVAELASLRRQLSSALAPMGLAVAAAGTHPLAVRDETEVSSAVRYRILDNAMRVLVRREPTMALHVHVGVPDPEDALRLLDGLRRHLPILLALSANSPFWRGRDSGFASARTVIFQAFPRTGAPRAFSDYGEYVETVDLLIASGAIPDPSYLWWDMRLQPSLGTVEIRVMDAQTQLGDVAPLVALIQSLARLAADRADPPPGQSPEVVAENRFLAARDGMDARLIDPDSASRIPVREMFDALVGECRPHAVALGCAEALDALAPLAAANGAARQRALVSAGGRVDDVIPHLAHGFLAPERPAAAVRAGDPTSDPTERSGPCAAGSPTPAPPSS